MAKIGGSEHLRFEIRTRSEIVASRNFLTHKIDAIRNVGGERKVEIRDSELRPSLNFSRNTGTDGWHVAE